MYYQWTNIFLLRKLIIISNIFTKNYLQFFVYVSTTEFKPYHIPLIQFLELIRTLHYQATLYLTIWCANNFIYFEQSFKRLRTTDLN